MINALGFAQFQAAPSVARYGVTISIFKGSDSHDMACGRCNRRWRIFLSEAVFEEDASRSYVAATCNSQPVHGRQSP